MFGGKNLLEAISLSNRQPISMGRDTYYSITECFNTPSIKFKEKLNAQYVLMGLYINLFNKYKKDGY